MMFRAYTLYQQTFLDCCKGYRPETVFIFLLVGIGIFLALFCIYPIVPHAPAFLHSFLLHDWCKGYRPESPFIFLLLGTGIFLALFCIYPIVPYASAFFAQLLKLKKHVNKFFFFQSLQLLFLQLLETLRDYRLSIRKHWR